jgi:hypothetical protein
MARARPHLDARRPSALPWPPKYGELLTAKYSNMPSNTGQSDSPGAPMLKRLSWAMYSALWPGVTVRMKEM